MTDWRVPLMDVSLGPEEIDAVRAVLESGWLSMGPRTKEFEEAWARFLGVPHALAVANGTAALHLACAALGLGPGDEVLCPALTFVATANAILYTGARPVFVDIGGPDDLNLSVADAARKVTSRTRAIMVMHYAGYPCDLDGIRSLAMEHRLKIIEDAAHAPGGTYQGAGGAGRLGTFGAAGCFSFFANKNLTTGEGGMVATRDPEVAARVRLARSHGMSSMTWDRHRGHSLSYDVTALGYNYRLDEMRAALGLVQLAKLPAANSAAPGTHPPVPGAARDGAGADPAFCRRGGRLRLSPLPRGPAPGHRPGGLYGVASGPGHSDQHSLPPHPPIFLLPGLVAPGL